MLFEFSNLGSIKEAALELNKLTIICGQNNTGKTYVTYGVYSLLKEWREYVDLDKDHAITNELLSKGYYSLSLENLVQKLTESLVDISREFSKNLHNYFNANEDLFKNAKITFSTLFENYTDQALQGQFSLHDNTLLVRKEKGSQEILLSLSDSNEKHDSFFVHYFLNKHLIAIFLEKIFPTPFIVTSERLGISLFYKELDERKHSLIENLRRLNDSNEELNPFEMLDKSSSRYAHPIREGILFTRGIAEIEKRSKSFLSEHPAILKSLEELIGGSYKHNGREIMFGSVKKNSAYSIPLYLGSSSVRSLSDLFFYLKYKVEKGDVLIIDEPESNLNPANQIKIIRLLVRLVNAGVRVFITTHSDYIIKELNNLIMLSNDFKGKKSFQKKHHYLQDEYISPSDVNMYVAANNTLTLSEIDNRGVKADSFNVVIDTINTIADELDFLVE